MIQQTGNRGQELDVEDLTGGTRKGTNILAPCGLNVSWSRGRKNLVTQKNERAMPESH